MTTRFLIQVGLALAVARAHAGNWPLGSSDSPHSLRNNYGEYQNYAVPFPDGVVREFRYFHDGIDMADSGGDLGT